FPMRQFLLALLILHLAACSSMQTVNVQDVQRQGDQGEIQPGDRVEIVTRNKETLDFAVTDITTEGIGGKFGFSPYDNIWTLKVSRPGSADDESYAWAWALLGAAALAAIIVSADSSSVCISSGIPCPHPNPE
ncbi:MAG: hypothetical protein ACREO9_09225, partial [Lysobacterales bacterium]